jgi:hypothetical protein
VLLTLLISRNEGADVLENAEAIRDIEGSGRRAVGVYDARLNGVPVGDAGAELGITENTGDADVQFPLGLSPFAIRVVVVDTPAPVYS